MELQIRASARRSQCAGVPTRRHAARGKQTVATCVVSLQGDTAQSQLASGSLFNYTPACMDIRQ